MKGRHNIVLTRQTAEIEGAEVVHSEAEAAEAAKAYPRCLVIGGASVYRQMMPYVDTVHLTQIDLCPQSDRFFPNLDASEDWRCLSCGPWQEEDGVPYRFATYVRIPKKED